MPPRKKSKAAVSIMVLTLAALYSVTIYLCVRMMLFLAADYLWQEKVAALALLLAEIFILVHGFGYFLNIFRVLTEKGKGKLTPDNAPPLASYPPIAVIVSSFKEPLEVVEETLICFYNMTYPNKRIYFLDDTRYDLPGWDRAEAEAYRAGVDALCAGIGVNVFRRRWRGAKAGMINDFLAFLRGDPPEGFSFTRGEGQNPPGDEKYVIVFDADMNPVPDFAEPLVAHMEADDRLAFIQTPQYYSNFEHNRVARAAGLQQAVFYEYICEGKSMQDAMFCCGTNVIFRREALDAVGGFDESSVTEDFATSLKFHTGGWSSAYMNTVTAFGLGPEDLGGYFKQQFRWAQGTVGLLRTIVLGFFRHPRALSASKWWEYLLSGSHYFVGWVLLVTMICPPLYLFFGLPSYFASPELYLMFFAPYMVLTITIFFWTLRRRSYGFGEVATGIVLQAVCFPVYMKASLLAVLGVRGSFGITPKGRSLALPLTGLWPQLLLALFSLAAAAWGLARYWYERQAEVALAANAFWCLYHFALLSVVLYFNHPLEEPRHDDSPDTEAAP